MFIVYLHHGNGGKTKLKSFKTFKAAEKYSINYHIIDNDNNRTIGKHTKNWYDSMVGDTFIS